MAAVTTHVPHIMCAQAPACLPACRVSDAIEAYNSLARQRTEQGGTIRERLSSALGTPGGRGGHSHPPARTISNWADFLRDMQEAPTADDEGAATALATSRYAPSRLRSVAVPELTGEQPLIGCASSHTLAGNNESRSHGASIGTCTIGPSPMPANEQAGQAAPAAALLWLQAYMTPASCGRLRGGRWG